MNKVKDLNYIKLFGENLRAVRLSKKISQESLAFSSDIPISQVGRIERGEINTTISTVRALSIALEIETNELFNFVNIETK